MKEYKKIVLKKFKLPLEYSVFFLKNRKKDRYCNKCNNKILVGEVYFCEKHISSYLVDYFYSYHLGTVKYSGVKKAVSNLGGIWLPPISFFTKIIKQSTFLHWAIGLYLIFIWWAIIGFNQNLIIINKFSITFILITLFYMFLMINLLHIKIFRRGFGFWFLLLFFLFYGGFGIKKNSNLSSQSVFALKLPLIFFIV